MKTVLFFFRPSLSSFLIFFLSFEAISQTFTIQGRVLDADTKEFIEGATVTLRNTQFGDQTGAAGNFSLKGITEEKYTLAITMSGYNLYEKVVRISGDLNLGNLYLVKVTSQTRQIILDVVASKNGFR